MNKRPIIIDTDPGVDDFFCLMMAQAHSDKFDIRGLTTICGNNYTEVTTYNALAIAKMLGIDTKVARGADQYLLEPYGEPVVSAHGKNGVADIDLPKPDKEAVEEYAWDFIYKEAVACNGELELVPVGPLTNIAIALIKYPELKNLIKKITIMGGGSFVGNLLPLTEANVGHDALAADVVFRSGIPITMVGLNVTEQSVVNIEDIEENLKHIPDDLADAVRKMIAFRSGEALHDAVAVGILANPDIAVCEDYYVAIETLSPLTAGQTIVDFNGVAGKPANVSVAMDISVDRYKDMFREMIDFYRV